MVGNGARPLKRSTCCVALAGCAAVAGLHQAVVFVGAPVGRTTGTHSALEEGFAARASAYPGPALKASSAPGVTAIFASAFGVACAAAALTSHGRVARGRRSVGGTVILQAGKKDPKKKSREFALEDESEMGGSILQNMKADEEQEEAEELEAALDNENWMDDEAVVDEVSEEELARRGERQVIYTLKPSWKYILYVAKKNAIRQWTKDGPGGRNSGCLEVQIAVATEKIRIMVLHLRENQKDFKCRLKLIQLVAMRRRMLDKLSWKDLDSYLKLREALKIRHVYRMEALIGRLPAYKFAIRDRKAAPGRKTLMRLKKTKRLLERRLATQTRQGRPTMTLNRTMSKIRGRRWSSSAYDDVSFMQAGKGLAPETLDPLNMP
mmetsp:Transcript_28576/g.62346  ORF Transcript_28576/g.62346 Transcript_28576/m.62346 type:complete len:380 (+) Transcript_28576:65-1204(+)